MEKNCLKSAFKVWVGKCFGQLFHLYTKSYRDCFLVIIFPLHEMFDFLMRAHFLYIQFIIPKG